MRIAPFLLLLAVAGCDTVSDAADEAACQASGYADEGTVSASVSGDAFAGTCVRADVEQGVLSIVGADNVVSNNNQEVITLTFPTTEIRAYEIDDPVGTRLAAASFTARTEDPDDQADEAYLATRGTLSLTAYTESSASGTFSFTARTINGAEVVVSAGTFAVTF